MSDILEELRGWRDEHGYPTPGEMLDKATAEITRLRAEVARLLDPEPSRGVPPGDGWRFLRRYEIVLEGDEFFDTSSMSGGWKPTRDAGEYAGGLFYRRRVASVAEMLDAIRGAQDERPVSAAEAAALGPDAPKNRPTVDAKSLPSRPENPGDGYRWVEPGETLQPGDQFFWRYFGKWENTGDEGHGLEANKKQIYRRRVDVVAPSAGVQSVVVDMLNILVGNTADNDEKHAALVTLAEALFPGQQNTVNRLSLSATKKELVSLQEFRVAVEHVTENGKTKRSMSSSAGWAVVHKDRLLDLEIAEERLAIAEERLAAAAISAEAAPSQACVTGTGDTAQEPAAWGVYRGDDIANVFTTPEVAAAWESRQPERYYRIVPLYAAPPAGSVTLTGAERASLDNAARWLVAIQSADDPRAGECAATIRGLLARSAREGRSPDRMTKAPENVTETIQEGHA
jgi:hypothetical protein